jgi:hypothetical protein
MSDWQDSAHSAEWKPPGEIHQLLIDHVELSIMLERKRIGQQIVSYLEISPKELRAYAMRLLEGKAE